MGDGCSSIFSAPGLLSQAEVFHIAVKVIVHCKATQIIFYKTADRPLKKKNTKIMAVAAAIIL